MTRRAWVAVFVLAFAGAAHAQPSQLSVTAAAQIFTADQFRLGSLNRVEPDLGVAWIRPGVFGGNAGVDLNLTRRGDALRLGRGVFSLKDVKRGGLTWDLTAGDTGTPPFVPDFGFSNLHAPTLTFAGTTIAATGERVRVRLAGGRTTQTRNLFGTDLVDLRQTLVQADVAVRLSRRVHLTTRGSQVRNGDLGSYPTFVDWAEDIGAGVRVAPAPRWQIAADVGVSRFQRRGSPERESAPSWLIGTTVSGARGRFELNAQRFSAGRFAAMNYPYNDRQGVFASGELRVASPVTIFAGADVARTNLDEAASARAAVAMPRGVHTRGFGGLRVHSSGHSTLSLRAEGGAREISPSRFAPGFESDTGAFTAEWQGNLLRSSLSARYEQRTNVDASHAPASFRQHEFSGRVFFHLAGARELFAQAFLIQRADRAGGGGTDWFASAGFQTPVAPLYLRVEGTVGRADDKETGRSSERQMVVASVSGQVAKRTFVSADIVVNHVPLSVEGSRPWFTRSMVRVTRTMTYGAPLLPSADGSLPLTGPMGALDTLVFVDWNANGVRDADEETADGIGVLVARLGTTATGRDGRASFARVPVGERLVSLDLSTVPADFDLPPDPVREVPLDRGARASVAFGLIPVGSIIGSVFADLDGSGTLTAGDRPIYDAVVTIDDEARSELAREGRFRFDNVRLGRHTVALAMDSLEEGAALTGPSVVDVSLTREDRTATVVFLVRPEKRPEIRRVFPPKPVRQPK